MIKTRQELKEVLKYEKNNYKIHFKDVIMSFFGYSEKGIIWRFQKSLRVWEYHLNSNHKLQTIFYKAKTITIGRRYGFSISPNVFGKGLRIMHLGSILVNSNTRIGDNCVLNINTAFVATGSSSSCPIIGNNLHVGIGATLVGNISLKNNVAIGAGAVVTKSFDEDNIVLGGVPAKIISYKGNKAV